MDSGRARLLRYACDRNLDVLLGHHHEVRQLVHNHDNIREFSDLRRIILARLEGFDPVAPGHLRNAFGLALLRKQQIAHHVGAHVVNLLIEGFEVPDPHHRQYAIAPVHLAHRPFECNGSVLGFVHHRQQ